MEDPQLFPEELCTFSQLQLSSASATCDPELEPQLLDDAFEFFAFDIDLFTESEVPNPTQGTPQSSPERPGEPLTLVKLEPSSPTIISIEDAFHDFQETVKQLEEDAVDGPHDLVTATKPSQERRQKGRPKRTEYKSSSSRIAKGLRERPPVNYHQLQGSDDEEEEDDDEESSSGSEQSSSSKRLFKKVTTEYKPHIKHFDQLTNEDIANIDFKQLTRLMKDARLSAHEILEVKSTRRKLKNRLSARVCSNKKRETCNTLVATNSALIDRADKLELDNFTLRRENKCLKESNVALHNENKKLKKQLELLMQKISSSFESSQPSYDLEKPLTPS